MGGKKKSKLGRISTVLSSLMLSFMLTVSIIPVTAQAAGGKPVKPPTTTITKISYVALGDSIATGTVTNWSNITSYVTYFYQYLQSLYGSKNVTMQNLAHDGDRSNELLAKLQNDLTIRTAVQNANVITISIGGNNLMQAADIPGFTKIDAALAEQGVRDFNNQWSDIIKRIKELNGTKNAQIIVNTVYNPYNTTLPLGYESDAGLHQQTNNYLFGTFTDIIGNTATGINNVINNNKNLGYKVADVYTEFSKSLPGSMGDITYFYPPLYSYLIRNPHPKAAGQAIITALCKNLYVK